MNKKGITVLICTYNGAGRLPDTLAHLSRQSLPSDINWEIIVIDNASTDNSADVARNEWAKYNLPNVGFRVSVEANPGKINALEKGTSIASFEYFIICDDDNWLAPDYVQNTYAILEKDAAIGAVGGQSVKMNDTGVFPSWFDEYAEGYAVGKQGDIIGDVTFSRGYVWGAGMGTRTELYKDTFKDFPSLLTGRNGEKLSAGEDSEYCQRLILRGYKLFYAPALVFHHYIPQQRLETSYRDSLIDGFNECSKILIKYHFVRDLKHQLDKNPLNRLRLLMISFYKVLFASSRKKRSHHKDIIKYLLHIKFTNDPVQQAIIAIEKKGRLSPSHPH